MNIINGTLLNKQVIPDAPYGLFPARIEQVISMRDGDWAIFRGSDYIFRVYQPSTIEKISEWTIPGLESIRVCHKWNETQLVCADSAGKIILFDCVSEKKVWDLQQYHSPIVEMISFPQLNRLLIRTSDDWICLLGGNPPVEIARWIPPYPIEHLMAALAGNKIQVIFTDKRSNAAVLVEN